MLLFFVVDRLVGGMCTVVEGIGVSFVANAGGDDRSRRRDKMRASA